MYNADSVVQPRWSPVTESLRSRRSYGKIGDSEQSNRVAVGKMCIQRHDDRSLKDQRHHEALRRRCFQTYLRDNT